jgi:hypothetical protein
MNGLKVILAIGIVSGGVHFWNEHKASTALKEALASADRNGFVELPPAEGQRPDSVYIVAAENCPGEAAQRADHLAQELTGKGIPVIRTHNVQFNNSYLDQSNVGRLNAIMNGPLPIVFIRSKAASSPRLDAIEAEFAQHAS